MRRSEIALAAAALLTGCTPVEIRGSHDSVCRADPALRYVGAPGEAGAIEGARRASGARNVRVVRPGEMVTMDFRPDRLTVTVDKHGVIERIACG